VIGTPVDLAQLVSLDKPSVRVRYELEELGEPTLSDVVDRFLETGVFRAPAVATA
jgi:predicted GTPase